MPMPNDSDDRPQLPARFECIGWLGHGASGVVVEAYDHELGTRVAVKVLRHTSDRMLRRFKREARAFADVVHRHLVEVYGLHHHATRWFMVMELIEGLELVEFCRPFEARRSAQGDSDSGTHSFTEGSETRRRLDDMVRAEVGEAPRIIDRRPPADFARVRRVFAQLFEALTVLHRHGVIHRDLKPTNVLVSGSSEAPRVVVLDLGLAAARDDDDLLGSFAGTASYAAPEQLYGEALDESCDLYAVGVMLYQALAGRLPYPSTDAGSLAQRKRQWDPPPLELLAPEAPEDLRRLCHDLLQREPQLRPRADDLAARMLGESSGGSYVHPQAFDLCVGREREHTVLREALRRAELGHAAAVLVVGRSGIGKSSLLRSFVQAMVPRTVVCLQGRCYAHERIAFRGLDGVVEGIVRWLQQSSEETQQALGTIHGTSELGHMFPAFAPWLPPQAGEVETTPRERRTRAFEALAALVQHLASITPMLVILDDAQWLDNDGAELLEHVFAREIEGCLVVIGLRTSAHEPWRETRVCQAFPWAVELELGPLGDSACLTLVRHLGRFELDDHASALAIANDAAGDPLLVRELLAGDEQMPQGASLGEALALRVRALAPLERQLLEAIALATRPLRHSTLLSVQPQAAAEVLAAARSLRMQRLVRSVQHADQECLDTFHDSVRRAVLNELDEPRRLALHTALAEALATTSGAAQASERAHHLVEAGELQQAASFARAAAREAQRALAFERAVELLRLAMRSREQTDDEFTGELTHALIGAGRGREAADLLLMLARRSEGPRERSRALQQAAEQMLTSGELDRGLALLREVLSDAGERLPQRRAVVFAKLVWQKLKPQRKRSRALSAAEREQLERRFHALRTVAFGLGMIDNLYAALCHAKALSLARRLGDPRALGEVLATEAIFRGTTGTHARSQAKALVDEARRLGEAHTDESVLAWAFAASAVLETQDAPTARSIERMEQAERRFHGAITCASWARSSVYVIRANSLRVAGSYRRLGRLARAGILDARRRGDLYLETTLLRGAVIVHLVADRPDAARADLARAHWAPRDRNLHIQHWMELDAQVEIALYEGSAESLFEIRHVMLHAMRRSLLGRMQRVRVHTDGLIGRLLLARSQVQAIDRSSRRTLTKLTARLDLEQVPQATAQAALLRAGVHCLDGDLGRAQLELQESVRIAEAAEMHAHAATARLCLSRLVTRGATELEREAHAFFEREGVREPLRLTRLYAPGCMT